MIVKCKYCGYKEKFETPEDLMECFYSDPHNPDLEFYQCVSCGSIFPFVGVEVECDELGMVARTDQDGVDTYLVFGDLEVPLRLYSSLRNRKDQKGFEDIKEYHI